MFVLSLLPVALLLWFVYKCDYKPEPFNEVMRGLYYGALSIVVTFMIDAIVLLFVGDEFMETPTPLHQLFRAFVGAAIPEECSKLLMLSLLLRKNKYFDEHIDGIVYAACVGLGFAGVENYLYVSDSDDWLGVALQRSVTAVPCHFLTAVAMGYFYSLYRFDEGEKNKWGVLMIAVPILFHGVYDALLMISSVVGEFVSVVMLLVFIWWLNGMRKFAKEKIADANRLDGFDCQGHPAGGQGSNNRT